MSIVELASYAHHVPQEATFSPFNGVSPPKCPRGKVISWWEGGEVSLLPLAIMDKKCTPLGEFMAGAKLLEVTYL